MSQQHTWYKRDYLPEESEQLCEQVANNVVSVKERLNKLMRELSSLQEESSQYESLMKELAAIIEKGSKSAEKLVSAKGNQKSSDDAHTIAANYNVSSAQS